LNTNVSAEKGTAATKTAAANVEKVRKPRKGSAGQDTTSCKFYVGEIKDGLPVMSKEVSEKDALLDCVRTQRPFMMVQLWTTASNIEDGRLVVVKTPVAIR
jgi:hypothetical protein